MAQATVHIIKYSNYVAAHTIKAHSSVNIVTGLWAKQSELQRHPDARHLANSIVYTYFNIM